VWGDAAGRGDGHGIDFSGDAFRLFDDLRDLRPPRRSAMMTYLSQGALAAPDVVDMRFVPLWSDWSESREMRLAFAAPGLQARLRRIARQRGFAVDDCVWLYYGLAPSADQNLRAQLLGFERRSSSWRCLAVQQGLEVDGLREQP